MSFTEGPSGPRASFWRRLGAALVDGIILALSFSLLLGVLKTAGYAVSVAFGVAYFVFCEGGPSGQTLGKRALGIRVIDAGTGEAIGYGRAFVRYLGRIVSGFVVYLGYLWMLWDREKQCWHDKLARDVVVPEADYPPPGPR
jgi:uncharacterized RDD family membrane protein YckC